MSRPSLRVERRAEITAAFACVLAQHGQAGASIARIADEAGVAPGLVHHHFASKSDLYQELLTGLNSRLDQRLLAHDGPDRDPLDSYIDATLALGERADTVAARAWVGLLAEALATPALAERVRRMLDREIERVQRRSNGSLTIADASAVVAFVLGALVFGAFAPRRTAGFAAPALRRMISALAAPTTRRV